MKISFKNLVLEYNRTHEVKTSQRDFARYLVEQGKYQTLGSADEMIQYYNTERAKTFDRRVIELAEIFFKTDKIIG